jgi:hypothetical protein
LDLQLRAAPNPRRDLRVYDFRLSRIVAAGTSAVLTSLKVIFFEPSTQSGLAGRFLDWG